MMSEFDEREITPDLARSLMDWSVPGWREAPLKQARHSLLCPLHEDHDPSLSILDTDDGPVWKCWAGCGEGGAYALAVRLHGEDTVRRKLDTLRDGGGGGRAQHDSKFTRHIPRNAPPTSEVEVLEDPTSAQIAALKRSRRLQEATTLKDLGIKLVRARFRQDASSPWSPCNEWLGIPTLAPGSWKLWALNRNGVARLKDGSLIRRNAGPASIVTSPELRRRNGGVITRLWDVEGESDLVSSVEAGLSYVVATTGGAASTSGHDAHSEYLRAFAPDEVVICGDLDKAGRAGAEKRTQWWLGQGVAVRVLELPAELGEKGDLRDYLNGRFARDGRSAANQLGDSAALNVLADRAELRKPASGASNCVREPILVRMADVEPEKVEFLWPPYLPKGKLALLEGDPGLGKTYLALALAAAISRGLPLPGTDGGLGAGCAPANVLYLTAEDGLGDTLRPRLDAAGADPERVFVLDGMRGVDGKTAAVTLADLDVLELAAVKVQPVLVVVDPIQGYLGAATDMHRANEVRPLLTGIARLGERFGFAAVAIRHLRKSSTDRAVHRGLGSIDFAAAARSILLIGEDPENEERRILAHAKSNLAKGGPSLAFEIADGRFRWAGSSELRADDLLAPRDEAGRAPRKDAEAFLREVLASGPVAARQVQKQARENGIAERTLSRAKADLRVVVERIGSFGSGGAWHWRLPKPASVLRLVPRCHIEAGGSLSAEEHAPRVSSSPDNPGGSLSNEHGDRPAETDYAAWSPADWDRFEHHVARLEQEEGLQREVAEERARRLVAEERRG